MDAAGSWKCFEDTLNLFYDRKRHLLPRTSVGVRQGPVPGVVTATQPQRNAIQERIRFPRLAPRIAGEEMLRSEDEPRCAEGLDSVQSCFEDVECMESGNEIPEAHEKGCVQRKPNIELAVAEGSIKTAGTDPKISPLQMEYQNTLWYRTKALP